jgi:hypothetical protein
MSTPTSYVPEPTEVEGPTDDVAPGEPAVAVKLLRLADSAV